MAAHRLLQESRARRAAELHGDDPDLAWDAIQRESELATSKLRAARGCHSVDEMIGHAIRLYAAGSVMLDLEPKKTPCDRDNRRVSGDGMTTTNIQLGETPEAEQTP